MGCVNSTEPESKVSPEVVVRECADLDQHARQAPEPTRNSVDEIYQYLSSASTEPADMVRLIFVWVTEFIGHSAESESTEKSSLDVNDILKTRATGSLGYVKLFEALCRRAGIPVENIQGFAKGTNHSPDSPYSLTTPPNHAWSAVQLSGQWKLVDCAWGAGHLQRDGQYKHNFDAFYFLTDPHQLIVTHFPLMDENFEKSKRWQLLKKPITLDEFNKRLTPYPEAFKFKLEPATHKDATIVVNGEEKITFKIAETKSMIFMSSLWLVEDNKLVEQSNKTFDTIHIKEYSVLIRPNVVGTFHLRIFGGRIEESGKEVEDLPLLFRYIIKCTGIIDSEFEYPEVSEKALTHECLLLKPLNGKMSRDSSVELHLKCDKLDELMINNKSIKGFNGEFKDTLDINVEESTLTIYGSNESSDKFIPLYGFEVV